MGNCGRCGDPLRIDDIWVMDGMTLCGPCAYEDDPDFVEECEEGNAE